MNTSLEQNNIQQFDTIIFRHLNRLPGGTHERKERHPDDQLTDDDTNMEQIPKHTFYTKIIWECDPKTIRTVINHMYDQSDIPGDWCKGIVVLLHKKLDKTKLTNFRPITLLPTLEKIMMGLIKTRMTRYLENQHIIHPSQHGFRAKHECLQQILTLQELCQRRKWLKKQTWLLFIDFEKAYDSIWYDGLWYKLARCGVGGKMLKFIRKIYSKQTGLHSWYFIPGPNLMVWYFIPGPQTQKLHP